MRKTILIMAMVMGSIVTMKSQSINGVAFKDIDVEFMQIVGYSKLMSNKVKIIIDFGQQDKYFSSKDDGIVLDKNGERMVFNSMIDALNFMTGVGYEYIDTNSYTMGNQNVAHFLLRRI